MFTKVIVGIDEHQGGSRGCGPLGRLAHGSTSQALARTARCPLLVLTRASEVAATDEITDRAIAAAV